MQNAADKKQTDCGGWARTSQHQRAWRMLSIATMPGIRSAPSRQDKVRRKRNKKKKYRTANGRTQASAGVREHCELLPRPAGRLHEDVDR
eukprot:2973700-Rhodomonas_salina.2